MSLLAGCQISRVTLEGTPNRQLALLKQPADTRVVLLHDSQGPQATPATLTKAEASGWHKQE
ncbi:hypothetical protein [Hymenobacter weizhouensis]|uniref:hypothetical protein n=1 Tax=Hymenobacter sp. YIM 151500-1 TaxID=2987689 RepID=UPI002225C741|nr:hypothetical protein [Hymenobacter sp. YIM 151500-1]UYZ62528.1 hypothetical protein OIS53_16200 [Hymenobacter sp. YIM 151500-1]